MQPTLSAPRICSRLRLYSLIRGLLNEPSLHLDRSNGEMTVWSPMANGGGIIHNDQSIDVSHVAGPRPHESG